LRFFNGCVFVTPKAIIFVKPQTRNDSMKIIVMGTGPFAVPSFQWLMQSEHAVTMLVTRPIEDAGRRRKSLANPMRSYAESHPSITIFDPPDINAAAVIERLAAEAADLLVVCDYGQILSPEALSAARMGGINLHGSLLPAYRGAAPINRAIYNGDRESGVTVIHMTPRLDGGPLLVQKRIAIGDDETAAQLEPRMAELGVSAIREALQMLSTWDGHSTLGQLQQTDKVSRAPRLTKQDGNIDWLRPARQLFNQIRAFQPWPGSFTYWLPDHSEPLRLIVQSAKVDDDAAVAEPGTIQSVFAAGIGVATGQGVLQLLQVQPAGKRTMTVAEFLRGRPLVVGERFGSPG
jgi:methionyl-tRNA formyltransferase